MDTEFNSMFSDNMRMLSRNFELDDFDEESIQNMSPQVVNRNSVIMEQPVEDEAASDESQGSHVDEEDDSVRTV